MIRSIHIPRRFVTHSWGGTETVVLESLKRLKAMGHPASIFTSCALAREASNAHSDEFEGIEIQRFPHFYPYLGLNQDQTLSLDQSGGNLFSWKLLMALSGQRDAAVLHLHTGKRMGGIARTIARFLGIPYVLSLHGGLLCRPTGEVGYQAAKTTSTFEWGKALGWLVGSRKVIREAGAVLCLTQAEKRAVEAEYPGINCKVLPNGVDIERFQTGDGETFRRRHQLPADKPLVGVIGRLDSQKGQLTALRALAKLKNDNIHLVLVGPTTDSDYEIRVERNIETLGLRGRVTRLEGLSGQDLVDAYHGCDALLIPSRHEPFGIVALEAWASGTPILASNVGGLAEIITDGEDGLLLESGDHQAFANALEQVLGDKSRRAELIRAGKETVQKYSWAEHTNKLLEIYQEVIREYSVR